MPKRGKGEIEEFENVHRSFVVAVGAVFGVLLVQALYMVCNVHIFYCVFSTYII